MELKHNVVGWFEIPVSDMDRAITFYEKVFGFKLTRQQMSHLDMAWFPWKEDAIGTAGSLVYNPEFYHPSENGTMVYFSTISEDMEAELSRVEKAGGKMIVPKRLIAEDIGYMAIFLDTEGNRVAIHSRK
ncbi:MAG: VOC family protein [Bacteroidales bacterium]